MLVFAVESSPAYRELKIELTRPLRKEKNAFRMAISAVSGDSGVFGRVNGFITALGRLKWAHFHYSMAQEVIIKLQLLLV